MLAIVTVIFRRLMMDLQKLVLAKCPILITGPSGVGKSYLAEKIHQARHLNRPFIEVDMAALHETIFDGQLFGHRKGAFTGAVANQVGLCQAVGNGTLFLDEIGDIGPGSQKKLLMLIEKRSFLPIGSTVRVPFRGNFIFATNCDIRRLVGVGRFREDLYYRIRVIEQRIRPLCERRDELAELLETIMGQLQQKYSGKRLCISDELRNFIFSYSWPGNIRELKNILEYLFVFSDGEAKLSNIPQWMIRSSGYSKKSFQQAVEDFERKYFTEILKRNDGRINQTSREIGISKTTLIMKARKYQIDTRSLRAQAEGYSGI